MRVQAPRNLRSGDFLIRFDEEKQLWECKLIGASAPYDSIIGVGRYPVRAMASWNVQAQEAKKYVEKGEEVPPVKKYSWLWWMR